MEQLVTRYLQTPEAYWVADTGAKYYRVSFDKEGEILRKGEKSLVKKVKSVMPVAWIWDMDSKLKYAIAEAIQGQKISDKEQGYITGQIVALVRNHPYSINKGPIVVKDSTGSEVKLYIELAEYKVLLNKLILLLNKLFTNNYITEEVFETTKSFFIEKLND